MSKQKKVVAMTQKVDDTEKINKGILSEVDMDKDVDIFDLTQYDINDLKQAYRDYRLTPGMNTYGDIRDNISPPA